LEIDRKNKDYIEKISSYELSIDKLNKDYETFEKDKKISKDTVLNAKKEKELYKELEEYKKQVISLEKLIQGYQRENEIMVSKDSLNKKEIENIQTELQAELRRNQQLQQQMLRQSNQVLVADGTIDLNKTQVNNLTLGGEIISI